MVMKIRRITPLSLAKIIGTIHAVVGLTLGLFLFLVSFVMPGGGPRFFVSGAAAPILLPIFYGLAGFAMGFIISVLYNFAAAYMGGIEIETE